MDTSSWTTDEITEWIKSCLVALLVATGIHVFVLQPFVVPTSSMAKTIVPGDYILVSKLHYGPRTPQSIGVPFLDLYIPGVQVPSTRLPGFGRPERGDIAVFHYPPEEKPIDQKTAYVKRIIGRPGDTVEVERGWALVNGVKCSTPSTVQQQWNVYLTDPRMRLSPNYLRPLDIQTAGPTSDPSRRVVTATRSAADALESYSFVQTVELKAPTVSETQTLFPSGSSFTRDDYGPVPVPEQNQTIRLTDSTWTLFERIIREYEEQEAERVERGVFQIGGKRVDSYTFTQDYFFVLGDNRDHSSDSRFWGYVPESHLDGQALLTLFSWDRGENVPRVGRTLHPLN